MEKEFKILIEEENSLKLDKELIEIQKTVITYGEKNDKVIR